MYGYSQLTVVAFIETTVCVQKQLNLRRPHPSSGGLGGRRLESSHIQRFFVLFPRIILACALLPVHHKEDTKIYQKVKAISTECLFHSGSSYFPCLLNLLNVMTPVNLTTKCFCYTFQRNVQGKPLLLLFFLLLSFIL